MKKRGLAILLSCLMLAGCGGKELTYEKFHDAALNVKGITYNTCDYSLTTIVSNNGTESKTVKSCRFVYNASTNTWDAADGESIDILTKAAVLLTMTTVKASTELQLDSYTYSQDVLGGFKVSLKTESAETYRTYNKYGYLTVSYMSDGITSSTTKFKWKA